LRRVKGEEGRLRAKITTMIVSDIVFVICSVYPMNEDVFDRSFGQALLLLYVKR
jgi:hypothetical protein